MNIGLLVIYPKVQNGLFYPTQRAKQRSRSKIEVKNYLNQSVKLSEKITRSYRISKTWEYWAKCNRYANLITIILNIVLLTRKKIFSLIS